MILNKSKSTLVVGENGAGKSSMLDALHFVLFGKPFRSINKTQLINTITNKRMLVEVELKTNNKEYMIRRGAKPNVFEIYQNGELINESSSVYDYQDYLEKNILKFNSKTFKQIVVLGSADYVPFMQLSAQNRRNVIEDLLDIQIFTVMGTLLREKVSNNKNALLEAETEIKLIKDRVALQRQFIKKIEDATATQINDKEALISQLNQDNDMLDAIRIQLTEAIDSASDLDIRKSKIQQKLYASKQFEEKYGKAVKSINKSIKFYEDNQSCPTCHQTIDNNFRSKAIKEQEDKRVVLDDNKAKADQAAQQIVQQLETVEQKLAEVVDLSKQLSTTTSSISSNLNTITSTQNEIDKIRQNNSDIDDNKKELVRLGQEGIEATDRMDGLQCEKGIILYTQKLLRDGGIKTQIIKQYVPVINKLINKYLAALDFFVSFEIDETFNETIKSRHRDSFTYASFSEGEKLRIDLSLMFTWRAIAKMRNSAATNLLIMDEVFDSSLDGTGTEEFLKILDTLAEGTNVFCISHKGETLYDKFHSIIKFEKVNNFSRIAKTA